MNNNFWQEKIHLKQLSFPRIMAAPIDGITDSPLRQLIREYSKTELLFSEMNHVSAVANEPTGRLLRYKPIEQPLAFQFSANTTNFMDKAVAKILEHKFVMLNLNAGCPAKNVIKSGSGSALMADPEKLMLLLKTLYKALNGAIPLTLKIRAGFKEKNALDIALRAQDCGIEMLIVHPRTQPGGFSAPLDFELVQKIKQSLSIPIVFSGNIFTFEAAQATYEKTGVDGFMIGRGLWGCPWKIRQITEASQGNKFDLSTKEMVEVGIHHLNLNLEFYGERGVHAFKKQLPQYIKNLPGAAALRQELLRSQNSTEMIDKFKKIMLSFNS